MNWRKLDFLHPMVRKMAWDKMARWTVLDDFPVNCFLGKCFSAEIERLG
jgi:hypothetical protein